MTQIAANIRSDVDQDRAVLFNEARNRITTLNPMGGYIWKQLEQGMSQQDIVLDLIQMTGEDAQVVERDVHEFLNQLAAEHLLRP